MHQLKLSAHAYHSILVLARTTADLATSEKIQSMHLAEALQYHQNSMMEQQGLSDRLAIRVTNPGD